MSMRTFSCGAFLNRVTTKSRSGSTATTDAEVILLRGRQTKVIEHVQWNLHHVLSYEHVRRCFWSLNTFPDFSKWHTMALTGGMSSGGSRSCSCTCRCNNFEIIKRKIARPEIRELQIIVMKEMMSKMWLLDSE